MPNEIDKRFDEKFDWKDCGNFQEVDWDTNVRECGKCGFRTQLCKSCFNDHHIDKRDDAIKAHIHAELKNQAQDLLEILKSSNDIPNAITRIENKITETKY